METKYKVAGIGELLWDLLPQGKALGGAPANFVYHAHQLGAEGYVISSIGKDRPGAEIVRQLSAFNIHLYLDKMDYPTGSVNVKLDEQGVPDFEIIKNVAWDYISLSKESYQLASETDAVCFGSLAQRNSVSRKAITEFVKLVPGKSLKIFDINLRQSYYTKELIVDSLKLSNILKINDDEAGIVSRLFGWKVRNEQDFCKRMLDSYGLKMVALTSGAKGSYLYRENEQSFLETPVVEVKDTVGAGDSFTAGMAMALLNNKSLKECHTIAVDLSAYVCSRNGAMPEYSSYFKLLLNGGSDS